LLLVLSKDDCKIWVSFEQIQNYKVSNLTMAKVKKVNITVAWTKPGKAKNMYQLTLDDRLKNIFWTFAATTDCSH
jgi:hypothetical protein